MKRVLYILTVLLTLVSCGEKVTTSDPEPIVSLSVNPTSFEVEAAATTVSVEVTSSTTPSAVCSGSWFSRSLGAISNHKTTIDISIQENTSTNPRSGEMSVICGTESIKVGITQAAKSSGGGGDSGSIPTVTPIDNDAWKMAKTLGLGWNMGNQLEANNNGVVDEHCWTGTYATQATFTSVKAKGFKSVRIPISWMNTIGEAPNYTLDETRLNRVAEVVGYAKTAGLNVIINIHHDGSDSKYWLDIARAVNNDGLNETIKQEITAVWTQVANKFKDEGDYLIFESFNEIHDGGWGWSDNYRTEAGKAKQNSILNEWNQTFVDAIRATGGNNATRWIGVPGYAADINFTLNDGFELPEDPANHIMVSVHDYTPGNFTQQVDANHAQWGHTRSNDKSDVSYNETYMQRQFFNLYTNWIANNVPVYIGEFGCANRSDAVGKAFQLYYLEYLSKCAISYGMSGFVWDNGASGNGKEIYGIIDHGTGEYIGYGEEIVNVMKKGFLDESTYYTLETVYNAAP